MLRRARVIRSRVSTSCGPTWTQQAAFVEDQDYQYYLDNLVEWKTELNLRVFSHALMTNHIHLIVGANDKVGCIGELMKRLAARRTRWVNKKEGGTGSLWESRYKVSPIDTDAYLLQCCRYVELNPVTARMMVKLSCEDTLGGV